MLERAAHSFDFRDLCPPGSTKTTPPSLEVSPEPSATAGCSRQHDLQHTVAPCPPFSRSSKRDSLHSINPAFRLASPSPSLSRATLIQGDVREVGFIPLPWLYHIIVYLFLLQPLSSGQCFWLQRKFVIVVSHAVSCHLVSEDVTSNVTGVLWLYIYIFCVSYRMKVNLSNTWKHNLEIFFYYLFMETPRTCLHTLLRTLKPYSHIVCVLANILCKQVFKSGNTVYEV